jgi:hypothetical protein
LSRSTGVLAAIGAVLAVIAAVAAIVVALLGDEQQFADGTPERTVQLYLKAVDQRDPNAAIALIGAPVLDRCGVVPRETIAQRGTASLRATLERTDKRGMTATVFVRLNEIYRDAPLGLSDPTQSLSFELVMTDGGWRFAQMPWPMFCAYPKSMDRMPPPSRAGLT